MTAAVPDPRFRDQLAKTLSRHYPLNGLLGVVCGGCNWSGKDREYPEHLADALAAEVEARVQAAATQRAAAARPGPAIIALAWHDVVCPESWECRDRVLHAAAQTVANTGHLAAFLDRLAALAPPAPS